MFLTKICADRLRAPGARASSGGPPGSFNRVHDHFDMEYGSHKCLTCYCFFVFAVLFEVSFIGLDGLYVCSRFRFCLCLLVVVVGDRSTFEIARSLVLSHRLLTFGITLVC